MVALASIVTISLASCASGGSSFPGMNSGEVKNGAWLGIFNESAPQDMASVSQLETQLGGKKFAVVMWFNDFSKGFPTTEAENVWKSGALPDITWEPWLWNDKTKIHLADITNGTYDQYILAWGKQAAQFGKPVMVRWGHEFNGNWYPWAVSQNGNNPQEYIKAYRHVHDLVEQAGAHNVLWVWCPNNNSVPAEAWNDPLLAYPGDQYVDMVGIDGYDFDGNASFSDLFSSMYSKLLVALKKPLYIGEMATGREGSAKAQWLQAMDKSLRSEFPGIKGFVWFDIKKERDWRLEQSEESLQAAQAMFSQPYYLSERSSVFQLNQRFMADYDHLKTQLVGTAVNLPKNSYTANFTSSETLDQQVWTSVPSITIQDSQHGLQGTVQIQWNKTRVFIHANISDAYPLMNMQKAGDIWNGDCLEFLISTNPKADPKRQYYSTTDWQVGLAPQAKTEILSWEWSKLKTEVPGVQGHATRTATGYELNVSFPWSSLGGFVPQEKETLGFDLAVDNAGSSGTRESQWIWSGKSNFYVDPSQWGTIELNP